VPECQEINKSALAYHIASLVLTRSTSLAAPPKLAQARVSDAQHRRNRGD